MLRPERKANCVLRSVVVVVAENKKASLIFGEKNCCFRSLDAVPRPNSGCARFLIISLEDKHIIFVITSHDRRCRQSLLLLVCIISGFDSGEEAAGNSGGIKLGFARLERAAPPPLWHTGHHQQIYAAREIGRRIITIISCNISATFNGSKHSRLHVAQLKVGKHMHNLVSDGFDSGANI